MMYFKEFANHNEAMAYNEQKSREYGLGFWNGTGNAKYLWNCCKCDENDHNKPCFLGDFEDIHHRVMTQAEIDSLITDQEILARYPDFNFNQI